MGEGNGSLQRVYLVIPKFAKATVLKITVKLMLWNIILHFMQIFNKNWMILTLERSVSSVSHGSVSLCHWAGEPQKAALHECREHICLLTH